MGIILVIIINIVGTFQVGLDPMPWIISTISGIILGIFSFSIRFLNGADSKAFIFIGIASFPKIITVLPFLNNLFPLVLEIYTYLLIFIGILVVCVFLYNLLTKSYVELEKIPRKEKIKIMLLCFRINPLKINKNYSIIEKIENNQFQIDIKNKQPYDEISKIVEYKKKFNYNISIWVYPNWPLIPIIMLSFIISLF